MGLSYNKLWKLMIDKSINKTDLHDMTGLSTSTITKLANGENVNTEVLERICKTLNCNIDDIVEFEVEEIRNEKKKC